MQTLENQSLAVSTPAQATMMASSLGNSSLLRNYMKRQTIVAKKTSGGNGGGKSQSNGASGGVSGKKNPYSCTNNSNLLILH